jgi:hypothetical protein
MTDTPHIKKEKERRKTIINPWVGRRLSENAPSPRVFSKVDEISLHLSHSTLRVSIIEQHL